MDVRGRSRSNYKPLHRGRWAALALAPLLAACAVGGSGEPTAWAGADVLRSGRGAAHASSTDATAEACATTADAQHEAAGADAAGADSGGNAADAVARNDGALPPDTPVFDAIADFAGWDGGDLGTAAFDGAVFVELPPFADVVKDTAAPDAVVETAAAPDAEVVGDLGPVEVDVAKDVGLELTPVDAVDGQAEVLGEVAVETVQDSSPVDTAKDLPGDAGADLGDAQVDAAKDSAPETIADVALDAGTDAPADTSPDAGKDVLSDAADAAGDATNDVPADTPSDGQVDTQSDVQVDAQVDTAAETDSGGEPCTAQNCDDGEPCTIDLCGMAGGCSHLPLDDGDACAEGTCQQALCSRNTPATYGLSCKAIKAADAKAKSGVWWLDPDGPFTPVTPFAAWCDMEGDGGGWTLLAKVAADKSELGYDAVHWTAIAALHPNRPRFDDREARLTSYWALPFTQLRVGLKATKQTTWLVANISASSLFHLIVGGKFVQLSVPEVNWLGLLPGAELLPGCRVQGFNAYPGAGTPFDYARARVGIVASAGSDCTTPGSRIGIGLGGTTCGQSGTIAAGAAAGCLSSGAPVNLPATGYLFAR